MSDTVTIPTTPPRALLVSMAMRRYHDFGLDRHVIEPFPGWPLPGGFTPEQREAALVEMAQLYEEVAGKGFYRWSEGAEQRGGLYDLPYACSHTGTPSVHPRADGAVQCTACANEMRGL